VREAKFFDPLALGENKAVAFGPYNWFVLERNEKEASLISENVVERRAYNDEFGPTSWAECTLCKYLKGISPRVLVESHLESSNRLEFNAKTQIFPLASGVKYLGFHLYLAETRKVVRLVNRTAKTRFKQKLTRAQADYFAGIIGPADVPILLSSHIGHLRRGHTYRFRAKTLTPQPEIEEVPEESDQQRFEKIKQLLLA
jgi:hypothetical protein